MNDSRFFPPASRALPNGLLAIDGELNPTWLYDAYTHGIFPWPITDPRRDSSVLAWWAPNPRGIFEWDKIHIPKRMLSLVKSDYFEITCDTDFEGVMRGCASPRQDSNETWVTPEMIDAYCQFHEEGWAHSVEARLDGRLVGGVYGVAINGLFAAESMFYREPNASKVALIRLLDHLFVRGFKLVDVQIINDNTARFGASEISRRLYMKRLKSAIIDKNISFGTEMNVFTQFADR